VKLKVLIAVLSVILAVLLAFVPYVHRMSTPTEPSASSSASTAASSVHTEPASSSSAPVTSVPATSAPATQPTTQPTTQAVTQPTTKPQNPSYSEDPKVTAFIEARMKTWICPVKDEFGEVVGSRTFASSRGGGKRAHAGLDFVAPHGTKVYAITSGTVQRVAVFYQNTWAVEVLNDDGSILRYCEIATELKVGDYVQQGDIIGTILRANSGTEMLHMEVYYGDGEGMLTQSGNKTYKYVSEKNYMRRSDLLDPTFLKDLPQ
jgi:murein DD-endopeptidase MepM/ murein hydrolase activator NlpD